MVVLSLEKSWCLVDDGILHWDTSRQLMRSGSIEVLNGLNSVVIGLCRSSCHGFWSPAPISIFCSDLTSHHRFATYSNVVPPWFWKAYTNHDLLFLESTKHHQQNSNVVPRVSSPTPILMIFWLKCRASFLGQCNSVNVAAGFDRSMIV